MLLFRPIYRLGREQIIRIHTIPYGIAGYQEHDLVVAATRATAFREIVCARSVRFQMTSNAIARVLARLLHLLQCIKTFWCVCSFYRFLGDLCCDPDRYSLFGCPDLRVEVSLKGPTVNAWRTCGGQQRLSQSNRVFPCLHTHTQNPSPYHHTAPHNANNAKQPADHLGLQYVTERILAAVLPVRTRSSANSTSDNGHRNDNGNGNADVDGDDVVQLRRPEQQSADTAADEHERELVQMLEQKHGKNYKLFDLESCIATVTLERLCELCKHMEAWLGAGREKVVVLQDR